LSKKIVIIGAGFAGLSAATFMARAGWEVHVLEKHEIAGGRARHFSEQGFLFDMGPSWYWMPDVFERYFAQFGKKVSDYYQLQRLDPSYRVYWNDGLQDIPASIAELKRIFESMEAGAASKLDQFLAEALYKYEVGMKRLVFKPGQSLLEFLDWDLIKGLFRLDVFTSMKKHIQKHFKHPRLQQLLEFPVLFLGAMPGKTPALYSLMNYADIIGGTWYPSGGMYKVIKAMFELAEENGVHFHFKEEASEICLQGNRASGVITKKASSGNGQIDKLYQADVVIGSADYHFIESCLLPEQYRSYSESYWNKRVMAPSCLLYYVGLNKKLSNVQHHSLFFDTSFEQHAREIYVSNEWPANPLFYVSATSVSDESVAPPGCENLFLLIPVAAGLENDSAALREKYFNLIIGRMEQHLGQSIADSIIYKKSFAHSDFINEYNAYKGNAYGLANTLMQTAVLKPSCRSRKVKNLFYTGQLTVPGPGVPPSLISGEIVAKEVLKYFT